MWIKFLVEEKNFQHRFSDRFGKSSHEIRVESFEKVQIIWPTGPNPDLHKKKSFFYTPR